MNQNVILFGDNLPILKDIATSSVELIYIDPPFNTGKTQSRHQISTISDEYGDRIRQSKHICSSRFGCDGLLS